MKKKPYQGQKMILSHFDQCGISLDMFQWFKMHVLRNFSLIYIMIMIREKKITTLCIGNCPDATTLVKICRKKPHLSRGT